MAPGGERAFEAFAGDSVSAEALRRLSRTELLVTVEAAFGTVDSSALELPQDGSVAGFTSGPNHDISTPELDVYMLAADELAHQLAARVLEGCASARQCVEQRLSEALPTLYRTDDIDEALRELLVLHDRLVELDADDAVEQTLSRALLSPRLLYHIELGRSPERESGQLVLSRREIANRISYLLWGEPPDAELVEADLTSADVRRAQAARMLADARAEEQLWRFHEEWLGLGRVLSVSLPEERFGLTDELKDAMVAESRAYVLGQLEQTSSFTQLLTSDWVVDDTSLAALYGASAGETAGRAGILTQASFLTATGNQIDDRRRIFRGKALRLSLLCQTPPPPPPAGAAETEVEDRLLDDRCSNCHAFFDPVGRVFDAFDAMGAATDDVEPASLVGTYDADGEYRTAQELAHALAESEEVQACYLEHWFRFSLHRHHHEGDVSGLREGLAAFQQSLDIKDAVIAIVSTPSFCRANVAAVGVYGGSMSIGRRAFLRSAGAASLALPLLPGLGRLAAQPSVAPKRIVFWWVPEGVVKANWWPSTSGGLSRSLTQLSDFRSRFSLIRGLNFPSDGPDDDHVSGPRDVLAGGRGPARSEGGFQMGVGHTIDNLLAEHLGGAAPHRNYGLGIVNTAGAQEFNNISWTDRYRSNPANNNPVRAFSELVSGFSAQDNNEEAMRLAELRIAQRRSVLDSLRAEVRRLRCRVGSNEREQLEAHLAAIRDIEQRLERTAPPSASTCTLGIESSPPESVGRPDFYENQANYEELAELQIRIAAAGVIAASSTVFRVQFMQAFAQQTFPFTGDNRIMHSISHDESAAAQESLTRIDELHERLLADFLRMLDVPECDGSGTVLDNTLVVRFSELGDGAHSHSDLPFLLAGMPDKIRGGQDFNAGGRSHTDLLTGLLSAFSVPVTRVGLDEFNGSPYTDFLV